MQDARLHAYVRRTVFLCLFCLFVCSLLEIPSLAASDNCVGVGRSFVSSEDLANAAAEAARTCHCLDVHAPLFSRSAPSAVGGGAHFIYLLLFGQQPVL
jgi:hypothetical protein